MNLFSGTFVHGTINAFYQKHRAGRNKKSLRILTIDFVPTDIENEQGVACR